MNGDIPRPMPSMSNVRLSLSSPAVIFVQLQNPSSHEDLLNTMLHQALNSVLGSDLGLSGILNDLFMNAASQPPPPKTSAHFISQLKEQWWSTLESNGHVTNTDCAICLSDFKGADVVMQLPCSHTFHSECVLPWLKEHNVCPSCRYALPTDADDAKVSTTEETSTIPGTVEDSTDDFIMDEAASELVQERHHDIDQVADEILNEMMDAEATKAVEEQHRHHDEIDDAIIRDTIE
ncbi:hypothetical protein THRCLA_03545 [Thraustotheca clavata]|uniref:RING-type domain-containing protein n=1 Tax=Thraustotheca clavata TaxID=74557 RepID=A0A1W0A1S0_9STRA|nr:hypothetical protein THRCLA_03545 [Thraustotheca clavata]